MRPMFCRTEEKQIPDKTIMANTVAYFTQTVQVGNVVSLFHLVVLCERSK